MTNEIRTLPKDAPEKHITSITFAEEDEGRALGEQTTKTITFSAERDESLKFCWSCDNAPSRGWQWNWGWGKCKCFTGWQGACCDMAKEVTDDRYGPYIGEKGTFEVFTQHAHAVTDPERGIIYPGTGNTDVPEALHGLWWMEGNPAAEDVASFGQSVFIPAEEGGCADAPEEVADDCSGSLNIKCYSDRTWSWEDSFLGRQMYQGAVATSQTLYFYFNKDFTKAQIIPSGAVTLFNKYTTSVIRAPVALLSFDMTLDPADNGDTWHRNSVMYGLDSFQFTYNLRRIVNGDGSKGKYWDDYIKGAMDTVLITKKMHEF
jgi:hypothetical protein